MSQLFVWVHVFLTYWLFLVDYLKSQPKGILARWYLRLSPFLPNLILQHKPGSANKAADALSCSLVDSFKCGMEIAGSTMKNVQKSQRENPELLQLIQHL